MTTPARDVLALRRRLGARLRPLALAIGVLISLGLPVTYYVLQANTLPQDTLIAITLGLLVLSTVTGVGLAFLVYAVPVRLVGGMEEQIAGLVAEITSRGERLRTVADLARAVSGSLELTAGARGGRAPGAGVAPSPVC